MVARLGLAGRVTPGTRCPRCNGRLERVPVDTVRHRLEPGTRAAGHAAIGRCLACGQLYWSGAHADAIAAIVDAAT